jgi:hemoglobin-like flavoprotein
LSNNESGKIEGNYSNKFRDLIAIVDENEVYNDEISSRKSDSGQFCKLSRFTQLLLHIVEREAPSLYRKMVLAGVDRIDWLELSKSISNLSTTINEKATISSVEQAQERFKAIRPFLIEAYSFLRRAYVDAFILQLLGNVDIGRRDLSLWGMLFDSICEIVLHGRLAMGKTWYSRFDRLMSNLKLRMQRRESSKQDDVSSIDSLYRLHEYDIKRVQESFRSLFTETRRGSHSLAERFINTVVSKLINRHPELESELGLDSRCHGILLLQKSVSLVTSLNAKKEVLRTEVKGIALIVKMRRVRFEHLRTLGKIIIEILVKLLGAKNFNSEVSTSWVEFYAALTREIVNLASELGQEVDTF